MWYYWQLSSSLLNLGLGSDLTLTGQQSREGLCLSKFRQRNPETRAVGCCLNYLFGLSWINDLAC